MSLKVVAIAVVVVAVAAGLWWLNGARTYDDLEMGSTTSAGPDGPFVETDSEQLVRKRMRDRATTTFGVSVLNAGDRDVEITGVGPEPTPEDAEEADFRLTPAGVRMNTADGPGTAERKVPFERFTLRAGRQRYFEIALRMPACDEYEPNSAIGFNSFDVRYRTLVFDNETSIPLRVPIEIVRGRVCT